MTMQCSVGEKKNNLEFTSNLIAVKICIQISVHLRTPTVATAETTETHITKEQQMKLISSLHTASDLIRKTAEVSAKLISYCYSCFSVV